MNGPLCHHLMKDNGRIAHDWESNVGQHCHPNVRSPVNVTSISSIGSTNLCSPRIQNVVNSRMEVISSIREGALWRGVDKCCRADGGTGNRDYGRRRVSREINAVWSLKSHCDNAGAVPCPQRPVSGEFGGGGPVPEPPKILDDITPGSSL